MVNKIIKASLRKKMNSLLGTISSDIVREKVKKGTIITGGSIASMLLNEPINDFDLYFKDKETALSVAKYYVDIFNEKNNRIGSEKAVVLCDADDPDIPCDRVKILVRSAGVAMADDAMDSDEEKINHPTKTEKGKHCPIFLSGNAITLSGKIQIIIRFFGDADKIHENFDFDHCKNYWQSWDGKLVTSIAALESLLSKNLHYSGSKYPLCSIIRTRKFIKKGWHINAGQYVKMAMQLNELNLQDVDVLEDQLIGVDTAFFTQLINVIKEEEDIKTIDSNYICSIIDYIF